VGGSGMGLEESMTGAGLRSLGGGGRPNHEPAAARRRGATRTVVAHGQSSRLLEAAARQRGVTMPMVVHE
jgi:hypothetical protein